MRIFLLAVAATVLAGCASAGGAGLASERSGAFREDADYIAAVEQTARRRGVTVKWVNPPQRRSDDRPR